jgi:hypothetical protein
MFMYNLSLTTTKWSIPASFFKTPLEVLPHFQAASWRLFKLNHNIVLNKIIIPLLNTKPEKSFLLIFHAIVVTEQIVESSRQYNGEITEFVPVLITSRSDPTLPAVILTAFQFSCQNHQPVFIVVDFYLKPLLFDSSLPETRQRKVVDSDLKFYRFTLCATKVSVLSH